MHKHESQHGVLEQINERLGSIDSVSKGIDLRMVNMESKLESLPDENRVREIVSEEQGKCRALLGFDELAKAVNSTNEKAALNTGVIETLKDTSSFRRSLAPAARTIKSIPRWAQVTIAGITGAGAIWIAVREFVSKLGG